jgi:hypothetical protein
VRQSTTFKATAEYSAEAREAIHGGELLRFGSEVDQEISLGEVKAKIVVD